MNSVSSLIFQAWNFISSSQIISIIAIICAIVFLITLNDLYQHYSCKINFLELYTNYLYSIEKQILYLNQKIEKTENIEQKQALIEFKKRFYLLVKYIPLATELPTTKIPSEYFISSQYMKTTPLTDIEKDMLKDYTHIADTSFLNQFKNIDLNIENNLDFYRFIEEELHQLPYHLSAHSTLIEYKVMPTFKCLVLFWTNKTYSFLAKLEILENQITNRMITVHHLIITFKYQTLLNQIYNNLSKTQQNDYKKLQKKIENSEKLISIALEPNDYEKLSISQIRTIEESIINKFNLEEILDISFLKYITDLDIKNKQNLEFLKLIVFSFKKLIIPIDLLTLTMKNFYLNFNYTLEPWIFNDKIIKLIEELVDFSDEIENKIPIEETIN